LDTPTRFSDVSPLTWPQIHRVLARVAIVAGEQELHLRYRTTSVHLRPNSWSLTLAVPFWVGEILGTDIRSEPWFVAAIEAQALISAYVKAADDLLDGDHEPERNSTEVIPKLLPLLCEANLRILSVRCPSRDVAAQYRQVVAEQHDASAWELRHRKRPHGKLSGTVLRRLAAKAAILRWPAVFVPFWLGQSSACGTQMDAILREVFLVMQLLDDLLDFPHDALNGQPNAVLIASGNPSLNKPLRFGMACRRSIGRVSSIARRRAGRLRSEAPEGTYFERFCSLLVAAVDEVHRKAALNSSAQTLSAVLDALVSSDLVRAPVGLRNAVLSS
jgi:hypothetical protein